MTLKEKVARELWNYYCDECGTEHNWSEQGELEQREYRERAARIIKMVMEKKHESK